MYTREGWKRELEWKPKLQLSVIKEIYESAYRTITALTARTMHACMQLYRKITILAKLRRGIQHRATSDRARKIERGC